MISKLRKNKGIEEELKEYKAKYGDNKVIKDMMRVLSVWGTMGIIIIGIVVCIGALIINILNKTPNNISTTVLMVIVTLIYIYGLIYNTKLKEIELKMYKKLDTSIRG